jgi:O-antigen/teichoic acid export membrane protein
LSRWSAPEDTGYYAVALNLALRAGVITQTLLTVLLPQASSLTTRAQIRNYVRQSIGRSLGLTSLLLLTVPFAKPFILLVYGGEFSPSISVYYLLLGITIFDAVVSPLLLLAFPLNMPKAIAAGNFVRLSTMLLFSGLLIPSWGMYGAAIAKLAAKLLGAALLGSMIYLRQRRQEVGDATAMHSGDG